MNVAELIAMLKGFPQNRIVVLQKDAEGNGYSPLHGAAGARYRAETTWSGETGLECLDDDLRAQGYTDEDVMTDGEPAVILHPVN